MAKFTTVIFQTVSRAPLALLALAHDAESDEELDPEEELDLEVEVTYTPGENDPGCLSGGPDNWEEPYSTDPEITSVMLIEGDAPVEIIKMIDKDTLRQLTREASNHQDEEAAMWEDYGADAAYEDSLYDNWDY